MHPSKGHTACQNGRTLQNVKARWNSVGLPPTHMAQSTSRISLSNRHTHWQTTLDSQPRAPACPGRRPASPPAPAAPWTPAGSAPPAPPSSPSSTPAHALSAAGGLGKHNTSLVVPKYISGSRSLHHCSASAALVPLILSSSCSVSYRNFQPQRTKV